MEQPSPRKALVQVSTGGVPVPPPRGGGIEAYILGAALALARLGYDVEILDRARVGETALTVLAPGVRLRKLDCMSLQDSLPTALLQGPHRIAVQILDQAIFASRAAAWLNARGNVSAVATHVSVGALVISLFYRGWREALFYVSHSSRRFDPSRDSVARLAVALENAVLRRVKRALVSTDAAREALVAVVPDARIEVVPTNQSETDTFLPAEADDVLNRYGVEQTARKIVLFVGRIRQVKGVHVLVEAVARSLELQHANYVIVGPDDEFGQEARGDSPYLRELRQLMALAGIEHLFFFLGAVPLADLQRLYRCADIFVLPSLAESSPRVVTEAMSSGLPVIAAAVGNVPRLIDDGVDGILVPPGDPAALTRELVRLLRDPGTRARLASAARDKAAASFSWDHAGPLLAAAYQRVLARE